MAFTLSGKCSLPFEQPPSDFLFGQTDECCHVGHDLRQCADPYVAMPGNRHAVLTGSFQQCNRHVAAPASLWLVAEVAIQ